MVPVFSYPLIFASKSKSDNGWDSRRKGFCWQNRTIKLLFHHYHIPKLCIQNHGSFQILGHILRKTPAWQRTLIQKSPSPVFCIQERKNDSLWILGQTDTYKSGWGSSLTESWSHLFPFTFGTDCIEISFRGRKFLVLNEISGAAINVAWFDSPGRCFRNSNETPSSSRTSNCN